MNKDLETAIDLLQNETKESEIRDYFIDEYLEDCEYLRCSETGGGQYSNEDFDAATDYAIDLIEEAKQEIKKSPNDYYIQQLFQLHKKTMDPIFIPVVALFIISTILTIM